MPFFASWVSLYAGRGDFCGFRGGCGTGLLGTFLVRDWDGFGFIVFVVGNASTLYTGKDDFPGVELGL